MVLHELAKIIRQNNSIDGDVEINLTMDLRRHIEQKKVIANIVNVVRIPIGEEDTELDIRKFILTAVKNKLDLRIGPPIAHTLMHLFPIILHNLVGTLSSKNVAPSIRKSLSGTLSSMGSLDHSYTYAKFKTNTAFAIPISVHTLNFFLTIWENERGIDVALGMPNVLATSGRLDKCMEQIVGALSKRSIPIKRVYAT